MAIRLVDHDPDGRQVKRGGGHVVRQVGAQPALPSQQRNQVLLAQEGQEEEGEGQEPEQDSHKQDEVNRSLVFVGGDGDPEAGAESDLQDPDDPQKTSEELHCIPPHLRLGRLGWHLSPPPVTVGPFFPDRAGASCQLQTAGKDRCNKTNKKKKRKTRSERLGLLVLRFEQKKELSVLSTAPFFLNRKTFLKAMFRLFRFLCWM